MTAKLGVFATFVGLVLTAALQLAAHLFVPWDCARLVS